MSLSEALKKSKKKKWIIRLKTKHPEGDCYDGVVLKEAKNFVVLMLEDDFEFDGIIILAKKFVKSARDTKIESCWNEIVRENKQINKVKIPKWLNACDTFEDVFKSCRKLNVWPGVETLCGKKKLDSVFYLGPIVGGNSKECSLHSYSSSGDWEHEYPINFKEVFRISIGDRYTKHFSKHMKATL